MIFIAGRLSKLTYPDGDSTAYEYDLCDRLVKVIGRDGGVTTYQYDANGSVIRCDRSNGTYTTYEYNARGELTLMENRRADKCSTLLSSYAYEYDRNGYITVETEKVDSYTYVREYTYDAVGQLVGYTETTNGKKTATYNYTYDNAGNRVGMEYYDSCRTKYRIDYVYDANNELISETKYNTSGKREFINAHITYTYDADGNLIEKRSGRYDVWQYFYTAESRLDAVTRGGTLLMAATYDGDNNRVFRMSRETDAASSALKVEGNIRCKWYRENGGCVSSFHFDRYDYKHHGDIYYYYDGCDYVWWGKGGVHNLAMHHNDRFDDCFIDHDHCDHDRDCKHDYENQKFVWELAEEAAEVNGRDYLPYNKLYKYNDYELIYYINDVTIDNEEVLVEYGANGTATGTYEYGNERLSVEYANHAKEYYLYNGTGNVTQTTAQNGSLYLRYTYDPFGNITSIRAPFAVDTDDINRYTYNGEDYDYTTGLQYLRARYYSPSTGSFISQDTYLGQIISPLSQNRYTYCHNNPIMRNDPSGHCVYCETTGMGPCSDIYSLNFDETITNFADVFSLDNVPLSGVPLNFDTSDLYISEITEVAANSQNTSYCTSGNGVINDCSSKNNSLHYKGHNEPDSEDFEWGVNIGTDNNGVVTGAFYVVADELPYGGPIESFSDIFDLGLGSYRAGVATVFKQWEYGGIGFDVITGFIDLSLNNFGIGINIFSFKGNIRIPTGNGKYIVIEGDIGVGVQAEVCLDDDEALGFKMGTGLTYGASIYLED